MDIGEEEKPYILEPNEVPEPVRTPAPEEPAYTPDPEPVKAPEKEPEKVPA